MSSMINRRIRTRFAVLSLMAVTMLMGSASPALAGPVLGGVPVVGPTVASLAGGIPVVGPLIAGL